MNDMKNILLVLEYDGTAYSGWQKQNNAIAVSDIVTEAIEKLTGEKAQLHGCGRTDAGVHALNYVCNFMTGSAIPPERFCLALNTELPPDIVCKFSKEANPEFHARFSTVSKKYIYLIQNTKARPALYRSLHSHYPTKLDESLMKTGAAFLVGRHDFRAFMASGGNTSDTVRTIFSAEVERSGDMIEIGITGDGFLYNMVRIISGTLIEIGAKRMKPEEMKLILESGDRRRAGRTAPPHGLYLAEVHY